MIESQRLNIEDVSEEDEVDNKDVMASNLKKIVPHIEGHDIESSGDSSDSELSASDNETRFVNPLLQQKHDAKKKQNEEEEWS